MLLEKRRRWNQDERPDGRRIGPGDVEEVALRMDSGAPDVDFEDVMLEDDLSYEELDDESIN